MDSSKGILPGIMKIFAGIFILATVFACATIVSPSGGPKDITPPSLLKSTPANLSKNFYGNKLTMDFSEFIELKDIEKYLLVSPPLNKDPDIRVKNRSLVVRLKDTLRSNTTYSFFFGDAIVDITEKNPVKNFSFAFATGNTIDSLSLSGRVSDAFTRMPAKDVLVMLYRDYADSVPMLQRPVYVSRTGKGGEFTLNNLAAGRFRIIALKDGNSDYLYNLPTEQIAFSDSLVEPHYIKPVLLQPADTIQKPVKSQDTTRKVVINQDTLNQISLDLFPEPDSIQRVSKSSMTAPHQLSIVFRYPTHKASFVPIGMDSTFAWSVREISTGRDTISCWLNNTIPDSLRLKVSDNGKVIDTIRIATVYKHKVIGKAKDQQADSTLKFASNTARVGTLEWNTPYTLTLANPLASYNGSGIRLIVTKKDTLTPAILYADSTHRRMIVKYPWKTTEDYELIFPKGAFRDIYNQENDSLKSVFKLWPKEEYGVLRVAFTLVNIAHPMIIQLLSEKGVVLKEQIITKSQKIDFGFLKPGKYGLKAIFDRNGNGRWDTGIYLKRIQPERTAINPKTFEVRGNWELEEEWKL